MPRRNRSPSRMRFDGDGADRGIELERGAADDLRDALDDLHDDEGFWIHQSHSLAVFATPNGIRTFRLPNHLEASVTVSDRFYVKPLFRAVTFPQAAFVLALAQGSVRLLEISASLPPHEIAVPDMPSDVAGAAGKASIGGPRRERRVAGLRGTRRSGCRQYARKIDTRPPRGADREGATDDPCGDPTDRRDLPLREHLPPSRRRRPAGESRGGSRMPTSQRRRARFSTESTPLTFASCESSSRPAHPRGGARPRSATSRGPRPSAPSTR